MSGWKAMVIKHHGDMKAASKEWCSQPRPERKKKNVSGKSKCVGRRGKGKKKSKSA
jgi:hypothetical protein